MCNDMYLLLWYHADYFNCPENPVCSAYTCISTRSSPYPTKPLSKLTPFIVSLDTLSAFQVLKQAKLSVLEAAVQCDPGTFFPLGL